MTVDNANLWKIVLYEGTRADELDSELRLEILTGLVDKGIDISRATCMCEISPDDEVLAKVLVLGTYSDAMLEAIRTSPADRLADIVDMVDISGIDGEGVIDLVWKWLGDNFPDHVDRWNGWFPIIDPKRCTNCRKCLSFCLFGVYSVTSAGRVVVARPDKCKTDCPACSRVCPQGAIIFPKHPDPPINGSPKEDASDSTAEPTHVNLDSISKMNIYSALRNRQRQNTPTDDALAKKDRCDCVSKFREQLGIPQSVIDSLSEDISLTTPDASGNDLPQER